jgi:hypothetical protein
MFPTNKTKRGHGIFMGKNVRRKLVATITKKYSLPVALYKDFRSIHFQEDPGSVSREIAFSSSSFF